MGITSKIFNGIAKAVKGFLDVGALVHFIKSVFRVCDVKPHIFAVDIFTAELENFSDVKTGRIHEGNHSFRL